VIEATIYQGLVVYTSGSEVRNLESNRCLWHQGEDCPRCDGNGCRHHRHCAGYGEPAGRPSRGGKALMGLRNRRGRDQPFYCLGCHPELGDGLAVADGLDS
jgi:hypothetical protein